jgi:lysophospholipase L1-like esterase
MTTVSAERGGGTVGVGNPPQPVNATRIGEGALMPGRSTVRTAASVAALAAGALAGLIAEYYWTTRRPLPSLTGVDASGPIGARPSQAPLRVVALGDSTLTGPGIDDPRDIWLPRALARLDVPVGVELISLAVGGSCAADVGVRVDEAVALDPDLVVVAVGCNDVIRSTPTRRFSATLDSVLSRLDASDAVVAVANIGDLGSIARLVWPLSSVVSVRSSSIRRAIETVVARHDRVVLLDVTSSNVGFRDRSVFAADLFHPAAAGHALWADAVLPGLQRAVEMALVDERDALELA